MMPQATDELRARWREPDGSLGERRPIKFLADAGYKLTDDWCWFVPLGHTPTPAEISAVQYMVDEWDYGDFIYQRPLAAPETQEGCLTPSPSARS